MVERLRLLSVSYTKFCMHGASDKKRSKYPILEICKFKFWQFWGYSNVLRLSVDHHKKAHIQYKLSTVHIYSVIYETRNINQVFQRYKFWFRFPLLRCEFFSDLCQIWYRARKYDPCDVWCLEQVYLLTSMDRATLSHSNRSKFTRGSAMAEGPRDALVSRNSATTKYPI